MNAIRWLFLGLVALCPALAPAREGKPAARPIEVERHKDIAYRTDKDADKVRHKLDVYCPKGKKDFPVVMFVHGGSWKSGNKNLYAGVGEAFAKQGIGMVVCNYRLSPAVHHPAHIEDVAKAFAWTHENIGKYGGKVENLFVCGHSAGGHLVTLLATDDSYLKAEKLSSTDIRGVISVSGVYEISNKIPIFTGPFGKDEEICKRASPLTHAAGKHPPFLIAYADSDLPRLDRMAESMHKALRKSDNSAELLICKGRNHITIITSFIDNEDSLNKAARAFVKEKCQ